jgi:hypothetical protein
MPEERAGQTRILALPGAFAEPSLESDERRQLASDVVEDCDGDLLGPQPKAS